MYSKIKELKQQIDALVKKCRCSTPSVVTVGGTEPNLTIKNTFQVLDDRTVYVACDGTVVEFGAGGTDTNMAVTDLTLDGNRTHEGGGFNFAMYNLGSFDIIAENGSNEATEIWLQGDEGQFYTYNNTSGSWLQTELGAAAFEAYINDGGWKRSGVYPKPSILGKGLIFFDSEGRYYFSSAFGAASLPVPGTPDKAIGVIESTGQIVTYDVPVIDNLKLDQIGISIDGGGAVITTGIKGYITVPYSGTITGWTILETSDTPIAGDIVVDVWKDTYANYPPTVADTIITTKPTLSGVVKNQNNAPTFVGAGATVTAGDIIAFNVDSVATVEKVLVTLQITKF